MKPNVLSLEEIIGDEVLSYMSGDTGMQTRGAVGAQSIALMVLGPAS